VARLMAVRYLEASSGCKHTHTHTLFILHKVHGVVLYLRIVCVPEAHSNDLHA